MKKKKGLSNSDLVFFIHGSLGYGLMTARVEMRVIDRLFLRVFIQQTLFKLHTITKRFVRSKCFISCFGLNKIRLIQIETPYFPQTKCAVYCMMIFLFFSSNIFNVTPFMVVSISCFLFSFAFFRLGVVVII